MMQTWTQAVTWIMDMGGEDTNICDIYSAKLTKKDTDSKENELNTK